MARGKKANEFEQSIIVEAIERGVRSSEIARAIKRSDAYICTVKKKYEAGLIERQDVMYFEKIKASMELLK